MAAVKRPYYELGQVVRLKKAHPCGSWEWTITRTGIDIGLRCAGCGRRVLMPRREFERACKATLRHEVE